VFRRCASVDEVDGVLRGCTGRQADCFIRPHPI
jgi:hypothetical protein